MLMYVTLQGIGENERNWLKERMCHIFLLNGVYFEHIVIVQSWMELSM